MAGLGLMNALQGYQQGVAWKQNQDELARQQDMRSKVDQANQAATGVIDASKQEWAANGAQGQYRPNDTTMFKAAEARSAALAKHGLWDQFLQNETQVAPLRIKARATALQQYEADGDPVKLATTIYPTLFDGKEIVGSEKIDGAGKVPAFLKLKLSDGTTKQLDANELVRMVKTSLVDPQQAMKQEVMLNYERAKNDIATGGKLKVEGFKADSAAVLQKSKDEAARGLADVKFGHEKEITGMTNASRESVAAGNNKATLGAAGIHAGASKYSADQGLAGAKMRSEATLTAASGKGKNELKDFSALHRELTKVVGASTPGLVGSTKVSDEDTLKMARYAHALIQRDDVEPQEAMQQAIDEWKRRNPGGRKK